MRTIVRMEYIGQFTLYLIEDMEDGWIAPLYFIERVVGHQDGTQGPRVNSGLNGFSNMDEAFRFGRAWCAPGPVAPQDPVPCGRARTALDAFTIRE
jgi:hypothetical protein